MPHINKTLLQIIKVMNYRPGRGLVDPLLHFAPYVLVHWVKIWTVGATGLRNECGCLPFKKFDCVACSVVGALEYCLTAR